MSKAVQVEEGIDGNPFNAQRKLEVWKNPHFNSNTKTSNIGIQWETVKCKDCKCANRTNPKWRENNIKPVIQLTFLREESNHCVPVLECGYSDLWYPGVNRSPSHGNTLGVVVVWQLSCRGSDHFLKRDCVADAVSLCQYTHWNWYSFHWPRKDDRLSQPPGVLIQRPTGLELRTLGSQATTLTTEPTPGYEN